MPERFDEDDLTLFTIKVCIFLVLIFWTAGAFIALCFGV